MAEQISPALRRAVSSAQAFDASTASCRKSNYLLDARSITSSAANTREKRLWQTLRSVASDAIGPKAAMSVRCSVPNEHSCDCSIRESILGANISDWME